MIRKGRAEGADSAAGAGEPLGDMERVIMWEVHVLQELGAHEHVVRVMDVVDLVDATYIVMQVLDTSYTLPTHFYTLPSRPRRCGVHCDAAGGRARTH